ncbi:MAG: hypothetical protein RIS64_496 [Bacteroidota bacterium]
MQNVLRISKIMMQKFFNVLSFTFICLFKLQVVYAQQADSTQSPTVFSGQVGVTNNGFSIIPSFSLNRPAAILSCAVKKNKFSFEPDIRLVSDASKGGMLFWLRYRLVNNQKFKLRLGGHPAFSFIHRDVTINGNTTKITEMLRFLAFEVVPSYQIKPNWGVSAMYLQGHGMQSHGPQLTKALFLNTNISNIRLSKDIKFHLFPTVFFLDTDGYTGDYLSITGVLAHKKVPFTLQGTINQTFKSDVPGNQDFMWNLMVAYNFSKTFKTVKE